MMTTRFIVGVPVAAAITFGLFMVMRGMIGDSGERPEVQIYEPDTIIIGRTKTDSETDEKDLPEEEPPIEIERPTPPVPVVGPDTTEGPDGIGIDPVELDDLGVLGPDVCGQPVVRINPDYPRRALEQGIEGYAVVEFTVTTRGTVVDAVVVDQAPGTYFGRAAVRAVERWRYEPCKIDGKVQEVRVSTRLVFELDKS